MGAVGKKKKKTTTTEPPAQKGAALPETVTHANGPATVEFSDDYTDWIARVTSLADDKHALEAKLLHLRTQAPRVQESDPADLAEALSAMLGAAARLLRGNALPTEARESVERRVRQTFVHFVDTKNVASDAAAAVIDRIESAIDAIRSGHHPDGRTAANDLVRALFYSWPDIAHKLAVEPQQWPPFLRASDDLVAVIEAGVIPKKPHEKRSSQNDLLAELLGKAGIQSMTSGSVGTRRSEIKAKKRQP